MTAGSSSSGVRGCDWYHILGVSPMANQTEIRSAFQRLALATHPDKQRVNANDAQVRDSTLAFHLIREAAGVLLDPIQRAAFDATRTQNIVRSEGRISGSVEDDEVTVVDVDGVAWASAECRCGGEYKVPLRPDNVVYITECETCSLVVRLHVSESHVRRDPCCPK